MSYRQPMDNSGQITEILDSIQDDAVAAEQLLPLVYHELRQLAAARLASEKPGQTLQATALVHEAYMRLVNVEHQQRWDSRGHFFAAAAEAMRRILVEQARRKARVKRGGDQRRVVLDPSMVPVSPPDTLLAVNDALDALAREDAAAADIVKLRYFAGMSLEEAAHSLGISRAAAYRHWTYAKAWLRCALREDSE